jgi:nitroimidazol reductase NimA-like FMN-containing flavoprotein (pyridoxamine 5'-phosphate oxidase superfamily)
MAARNSRHGRQYEEDETMFRPVRKKANEISVEEAKKLLHEARRGVLAVSGDDGYPYAVPINYLYDEDAQEIIFHGSKVGHKVDALKRSDKVCFTVVSGESVEIEDEAWAPFLKSAVVFGRCHLVADRGESDALCKKFAMKYYPTEKMVDDEVAASGKAVQMFRISIDHISGKKVQER